MASISKQVKSSSFNSIQSLSNPIDGAMEAFNPSLIAMKSSSDFYFSKYLGQIDEENVGNDPAFVQRIIGTKMISSEICPGNLVSTDEVRWIL